MKNTIKIALLLFILGSYFARAQDNTFLKKYAGTYNMLADGQKVTSTSDKYVLSPDGKATWTFFTTVEANGTTTNKPVKNPGTWSASEGVIHLSFKMGDGEGSDMLSDYSLKDGVFRAEGVYLKKVVAKAK